MKTVFKILLATDYSQSVQSAEYYAVRFSEFTNSELTMLHVYAPYLAGDITDHYNNMVFQDIIEVEHSRIQMHSLNLMRSIVKSANNFKMNTIEIEGKASEEIIKEADKMQADFIVMGTHGETGFINRTFGNHTWEVLYHSNVPVLVVPQSALFRKWKNIVFATDYREGELPVVKFLSQMAKMFDSDLTILHISNFALLKELEIILFDTFSKEVKQNISYSKIFFRMLRGNEISEGLNRFCMDHDIELLVMSPQKKTLFEKIFSPDHSITKRMSYQTKVTLMAIPDYYCHEK
ncbi:MAG: universal stress protein [Bacteroidetes bacterium]|nr:universal stress protein [Bacteroidota bacterium]